MPYSPEVQARIDAQLASTTSKGPSFPMPRVRHNGETGEWFVREVEGDKNAEAVTVFERPGTVDKELVNEKTGEKHIGKVGGEWSGVIVRVAFMSQTKYKPDAVYQKFTREFTNFKTEPIEVLKRVFGPAGKTESVKTFENYQEFKAASMLKNEDGEPAGSAYDLKACLYVYHLERKQVVKVVIGGTARSEWFAYNNFQDKEEEGIVSAPWRVTVPGSKHLEEVVTTFLSTPDKTPKGLEYHRLSFLGSRFTTNEEMLAVLDQQKKVADWVEGWKKATEKPEVAGASLDSINALAPKTALNMGQPVSEMQVNATIAASKSEPEEDEIRLEDIPF